MQFCFFLIRFDLILRFFLITFSLICTYVAFLIKETNSETLETFFKPWENNKNTWNFIPQFYRLTLFFYFRITFYQLGTIFRFIWWNSRFLEVVVPHNFANSRHKSNSDDKNEYNGISKTRAVGKARVKTNKMRSLVSFAEEYRPRREEYAASFLEWTLRIGRTADCCCCALWRISKQQQQRREPHERFTRFVLWVFCSFRAPRKIERLGIVFCLTSSHLVAVAFKNEMPLEWKHAHIMTLKKFNASKTNFSFLNCSLRINLSIN